MIETGAAEFSLARWARLSDDHEVLDANGDARPIYRAPLKHLPIGKPAALRARDEQMVATVREIGLGYGAPSKNPPTPWRCDVLPHIFPQNEWAALVRGVDQRLRAFELFLQDVHGRREILREGVVPIHLVLGSPYYQPASIGLPRPHDAYLHLSGLCLARDDSGALAVKSHQFGRAAGTAYMMQNRRALARVLPAYFEENAIASLADTPLTIGEVLHQAAPAGVEDPAVVLLSSGPHAAAYYEHTFLARRTGISLVQGGDLLVLDDHLFLKTVRGLKRVDVVYNRIAEEWLDPLVLRKGSMLGVPGLVHCLRLGTVTLLNAIGSQLADDRALLPYAAKIIRFYLGKEPLLPTVLTYWLGDIDQREMVLENLDDFRIEPIAGESLALDLPPPTHELLPMIRKDPGRYIAQPLSEVGATLHFADGKPGGGLQDHLVFAARLGGRFEVFPGALTRVFSQEEGSPRMWLSKDSWVPAQAGTHPALHSRLARHSEFGALKRDVTSRVAEAFYWVGRYLERTYHKAFLIQVIETLESEELNAAERKEYRPMWNRLLPPLETSAGESRRSITTRLDRYRLMLVPQPGSVVSTYERVMLNAESVQDALSPEAWATLSSLRPLFQRAKFKETIAEEEAARITLRLTAKVTQRIPQFFAIAGRTMLGDDGWRFCEIGERLERAILTANAVCSIGKELAQPVPPTEIQLSAFLRLLGSRDAYRRIFQVRAEPASLLETLWQHPEAPRSVARCLDCVLGWLRECAPAGAPGAAKALHVIETLLARIRNVTWDAHLPPTTPDDALPNGSPPASPLTPETLPELLGKLLQATLDVHPAISDGFLTHQALITQSAPPLSAGRTDGV